jgi:CheY-like chemotaxis protein
MPPVQPLRVLIVEDDASVQRALKRLLNTLGRRAYIAQNMREALDLAASETQLFDLLLSNIGLPDGDGWELLRRLNAAGCRPRRAIAITRSKNRRGFGEKPGGGF